MRRERFAACITYAYNESGRVKLHVLVVPFHTNISRATTSQPREPLTLTEDFMAPPMATNGTANGSTPEKDDSHAKAFQGQQPYGMPADLVIPKVMELDNTDERLWVSLRFRKRRLLFLWHCLLTKSLAT